MNIKVPDLNAAANNILDVILEQDRLIVLFVVLLITTFASRTVKYAAEKRGAATNSGLMLFLGYLALDSPKIRPLGDALVLLALGMFMLLGAKKIRKMRGGKE